MPSLRNNQLLFEEVTRKIDDLMKSCYFAQNDQELNDTILKYFDYQTAIYQNRPLLIHKEGIQ